MVQQGKTKKIFDGRFEIIGIVGRGSQSVVYHARNVQAPDTHVALKVLVNNQSKNSSSTNLGEKLRKEALAMVAARHRYVVRIEDFHSINSLCYLSMEYAPLGDLRKYSKSLNGKLDFAQVERFFKQTVEALCAVHKSGIIHRDIKPDNILVINEKEIRLADFGVALLPGDESSIAELQKGVGTFSYMAPEVLEGIEYKESADLYSLGVTFYELLSGLHPFENENLIDQLKVRQDENLKPISKLVSNLPHKFATAIMQCMAYSKEDRPRSAEELLEYFSQPEKRSIITSNDSNKGEKAQSSEAQSLGAKTPETSTLGAKIEKINEPKKNAPPFDEMIPALSAKTKPQLVQAPEFIQPVSPIPARPTTQPNQDLLRVKDEHNVKPPLDSSPDATTNKASVSDIISGRVSSTEPNRLDIPPKKRIPAAAILAVLFLLAIYYRFSGGEDAYQEPPPKAMLGGSEATVAPEKDVSTDSPLMPKLGEGASAFPLLVSGVYHGEIYGLYPEAKHAVTFISYPDQQILVVIIGIEGWKPAVISTEGLTSGDQLKVASSGFVLQMTGQNLDDGEIVGYFKNIVINEQGEWRIRLVGGQEK